MNPSAVDEHYSFSRNVGRGSSGLSFSTAGEGRITAIRLWEHNNAYIAGSVFTFTLYPFVSRVGTYEGEICEILSVCVLQHSTPLWVHLVNNGWPCRGKSIGNGAVGG